MKLLMDSETLLLIHNEHKKFQFVNLSKGLVLCEEFDTVELALSSLKEPYEVLKEGRELIQLESNLKSLGLKVINVNIAVANGEYGIMSTIGKEISRDIGKIQQNINNLKELEKV